MNRSTKHDVLVADGVDFYRRMMAELLTGQGFRVTEAADADSALELLEREPPDVLLLDVRLPPNGARNFLEEVMRRGSPPLRAVAIGPAQLDDSEWRPLHDLGIGAAVTRSAPIDDILVAVNTVLFPDAKDLRRTPRAQLHIPVTYRVAGDGDVGPEQTTETFNLSADGMFLVTSSLAPFGPGTKLRLNFWVPGAAEVIDIDGVVIWCNQAGGRMNELYPPGMGVMFLGLGGDTGSVLDNFVRIRASGPIR